MKINKLFMICLMAMVIAFADSITAMAGKKSEMRVNYVLQNIGVKRDVQEKLKPLLISYLNDKKEACKEYDSLKDKLKPSIEAGTITDKQAQKLLDLKWAADEKELTVKRAYETKFKTVLSAKKTYLCFDLLNDKKSKITGQDKDDD